MHCVAQGVAPCVAQCVAACCIVLQFVLQRAAVRCSALQCVLPCAAVCCSVLQGVEVYCSVLRCVEVCCSIFCSLIATTHCNTLQHTATYGNTVQQQCKFEQNPCHQDRSSLQHTAAHCNTLQHTASQPVRNAFPRRMYTATHYSTLHCNTLTQTATHCNTMGACLMPKQCANVKHIDRCKK